MSTQPSNNSFGTLSILETASGPIRYHRLEALEASGVAPVSSLPYSVKVLLEAAIRAENGNDVSRDDIEHLATYSPTQPALVEIPFKPARVLVQDFTGVPAVVDLAALRSAMARVGGDPQRVNPEIPVDLVIDHSVQVDEFGSARSLARNAALEFERNHERYSLLHWAQRAFDNFQVVPPATGICHQVNLEYLAKVVQQRDIDGHVMAFPDSLVGLDSHTTMINGLGVLGWGVGGIEAEAVMLGQPIFMLLPRVVGVRLEGKLPPGSTATDLALVVTEMLRAHGVVGCFVEFFGPGLSSIPLADRATIANMAPEYGATCGFFPVDDETLRYLLDTGRSKELGDLVERYCKEQGLFRTDSGSDPDYYQHLHLDLGSVRACLAGPKRPQDRIPLGAMKSRWHQLMAAPPSEGGYARDHSKVPDSKAGGLRNGSVVLAAITSCTNTSNPGVMLAAGLLAKKAVEAGLPRPAHVKTSLAPGSKVVTDYLEASGLQKYLDTLGFQTVGYGCTTCIGNSGPLPASIAQAIDEDDLVVAGVLSGNRNFEGRIHQKIRANFLASPPLVVAYALAGRVDVDLEREPLGYGTGGKAVMLADIWPSSEEISSFMDLATNADVFRKVYSGLLDSNETWNAIPSAAGALWEWREDSTYVQEPPFFRDLGPSPVPLSPIREARVLVKVGDSTTTDHISPAGAIAADSPAGRYLHDNGVMPKDFNSYGSRRGNDRVMTRGTFANIRLQNQLGRGREGGWTTHLPTGELLPIFEAAQRYQAEDTPCLVIAGRDYGMGSSRDWAAKGSFLLGVRAVIAQSFERIHRSNLIGMGVLPLQFPEGESAESQSLVGTETITIEVNDELAPGQQISATIVDSSGAERHISLLCRLDTPVEIEYYRNGGILHTVLRRILRENPVVS